MPDVVLKYNLSCGNRVDYFSGLWASHRNKQRLEMMTDVTLIGVEGNGNGYKSVKVIRSVLINLITYVRCRLIMIYVMNHDFKYYLLCLKLKQT